MPSPVASNPAILAIVSAVCVTACSGGHKDEDPREISHLAGSTYILWGDHQVSAAPVDCTPRLVAITLEDLFAELSRSESQSSPIATGRPVPEQRGIGHLVQQFFGGDEAPFGWLTLHHRGVTGIPVVEVRSRWQLSSELNKLKMARLDLELTRIGPMRWVPQRGNLALGLILFDVRERGTHKRLGYGTGKGEYHCATASFEVLSLMVHAELPPWAGGAVSPTAARTNSLRDVGLSTIPRRRVLAHARRP
jgi:hypothetical protein